jgi:hypothetical protein
MGLIKEPKEADFSNQSKPWSDKELEDFRKIMTKLKAKNSKRKQRLTSSKVKKQLV